MREQLLVATGNPESKQLKDMIPEILKQVGPKQYEQIQGLLKQPEAEADDDDVPDLVAGTNFEQVAASK
jgi:nascent polypeptide-associated complex subunit beta